MGKREKGGGKEAGAKRTKRSNGGRRERYEDALYDTMAMIMSMA